MLNMYALCLRWDATISVIFLGGWELIKNPSALIYMVVLQEEHEL